jgi:methylenetetrahydrofolate dehydrogenase (NADP+)/methenyltetrahydrofolate cyclohydrolase
VTATIIDGTAIAQQVRAEVATRVARLAERGITPGFVDVLIGEEPASAMYVRMKYKAAQDAGMLAFDRFLPAAASREEALQIIDDLDGDPSVHGVLVQSPLPEESPIDIFELQRAISPE